MNRKKASKTQRTIFVIFGLLWTASLTHCFHVEDEDLSAETSRHALTALPGDSRINILDNHLTLLEESDGELVER